MYFWPLFIGGTRSTWGVIYSPFLSSLLYRLFYYCSTMLSIISLGVPLLLIQMNASFPNSNFDCGFGSSRPVFIGCRFRNKEWNGLRTSFRDVFGFLLWSSSPSGHVYSGRSLCRRIYWHPFMVYFTRFVLLSLIFCLSGFEWLVVVGYLEQKHPQFYFELKRQHFPIFQVLILLTLDWLNMERTKVHSAHASLHVCIGSHS